MEWIATAIGIIAAMTAIAFGILFYSLRQD
jgi:hypothetical protein